LLPGGFAKSGLASACAYAGPASSTVLPPAFRSLLLRGKSFPPSAASGLDWARFRAGFRSVREIKLSWNPIRAKRIPPVDNEDNGGKFLI
jgi:hypothetical protein